MSQGNVCRLCAEIRQNYINIYDESGNENEVHQHVMQYFDRKLLYVVTDTRFTVLCMKCWHQISDFNSFQQSVYQAQKIFHVKTEGEEFLPENNIASSSTEQSNDCHIFDREEATLFLHDSETIEVSSSDDSNVEHDDAVGVFIAGELSNANNSTDLVLAAALNAERSEALTMSHMPTESISKIQHKRKGSMISAKASDELIAQWAPVLNCLLCTETCSTFSLLRRHFQDKHPLFKCQVKCCNRIYFRRDTYQDHIHLHIDSNAFACKVCATKLHCRRSLGFHIRECNPTAIDGPTNDSNYMFQSINKNGGKNTYSNTSKNMNIPVNLDAVLAQWLPSTECAVCKKRFDTLTLLQCHFLKCHSNEDFYVGCCQRKFKRRHEIEAHVRYHVKPTAFKCERCRVAYSSKSSIQRHICFVV